MSGLVTNRESALPKPDNDMGSRLAEYLIIVSARSYNSSYAKIPYETTRYDHNSNPLWDYCFRPDSIRARFPQKYSGEFAGDE